MTRPAAVHGAIFGASLLWIVVVIVAVSVSGQMPEPQATADPKVRTTTQPLSDAAKEVVANCLGCHEDKELSLELKDGTSMSLFVDEQEFSDSVHGSQLICTDCHSGYDTDDHPGDKTFDSERAYVTAAYETCKKCHFDTYTRTLESVHYELLKAGVDSAPVCTDCHGKHNIQNPHVKRTMVSRSCAKCHVELYRKYAQSVHGKALIEDGNQDVPACTDCHTHHQIQQPGTKFLLATPEICSRCHADQKLMAKYGISAMTAQTYLSDFHGVTASLTRDLPADQQQVVVTCVGCHGSHDIASPRLIGADAMKATVSAACTSCHEGASPGFSAAWLSHYPPSLQHAPIVYLVDLFYTFFIPFAVTGLILHLLLHVYRVSAGR